ncbi:hypothetical protein HYH02_006688 [Chlamydomonas schloesseri]|uniref:TNFR-Cys domain-containing protein n=1 Tax=Chlamydomonas schloesseri TaxID=2026947 RepID=A0A835T593_9CHLO|nr:hypothetical protein HYH02_006688 [Chlamydomonas schloesseri]|eukprot:KAG2432705.1 hypothetical protein HYH02_006688 [Chlamydomonas schloesseri]
MQLMRCLPARRAAKPALVLAAANASSACLPCPRGWTSDEGSGSCTICPAGYLIPTSGLFAGYCVPCAKNTFSSVAGFSGAACQPCPSQQFAVHGSTSCAACPPGRYIASSTADAPTDEFIGDCVDCALNTYSDKPGSRSCKGCPAGTTAEPGSSSCTVCPAGYYLQSSGGYSWLPATCEPCPEGYYGTTTGANTCSKCPFGSTSDPGATSCYLCPAGAFVSSNADEYTYGTCTLCPGGTFNPTPGYSGSSCRPCPKGSAAAKGATQCEICPAGTFADENGLSCVKCPRNSFTAAPGTAGGCKACPRGTVSGEGATDCEECPAGGFISEYGNCMPCLAGTFNPTPGLVGDCSPCPAGHVTVNGGTACEVVPPGAYLRTEDMTAQLCPQGTYSDAPGTLDLCTPCPSGTTTRGMGARNATHCKLCPAGKYVNEAAQCVACPADTYSDAPGSTSCTACPPRYAAPEGSSHRGHCRLCPPGRFYVADPDGQPEGLCVPCPPNTYSNASGLVADTCTPCPEGTTSGQGAVECTPCPAGSYVKQGVYLPGDPYTVYQASCVGADVGFFTDQERSLEQLPCPLGSTTTDTGSTVCTACSGDSSGSIQEGVSLCLACDPVSAAGAGTCPLGSGRVSGCSAKDACEVCPAGTYAAFSPDMGRDACVPCPRGSISPTAGSTKCTACPAGNSTDRLGSSACTPCKPGFFSPIPGGICVRCPPGTFAAGPGATACTPCAVNTTHFLLSRTSQSDCSAVHVPGAPSVSLTETITNIHSVMDASEGKILSTRTTIQWTPARTVTVVPGGAFVPAPPGFTRIRMEATNGINVDPPMEGESNPPVPTFVAGFRLYRLAAGVSGGTGASTGFVLLVEYGDGGFKVCQGARPAGAGGKMAISCGRTIKSLASHSGSLSETETIKVVEA